MSSSVSVPSTLGGLGELQSFAASPPKVGRPRKPGAKSRDTARYRAWTGYLMRDTVTEAEYELKRTNPDGTRDGRDMSDLIQSLLSGWVAERKKIVR